MVSQWRFCVYVCVSNSARRNFVFSNFFPPSCPHMPLNFLRVREKRRVRDDDVDDDDRYVRLSRCYVAILERKISHGDVPDNRNSTRTVSVGTRDLSHLQREMRDENNCVPVRI